MKLIETYKTQLRSRSAWIGTVAGTVIGVLVVFLFSRYQDVETLLDVFAKMFLCVFAVMFLFVPLFPWFQNSFYRWNLSKWEIAIAFIRFTGFVIRFLFSVATNMLRFGIYATLFALLYSLWDDVEATRHVLATATQEQVRNALSSLFNIAFVGGVIVTCIQMAVFSPQKMFGGQRYGSAASDGRTASGASKQ